jgi:hypothetical protein
MAYDKTLDTWLFEAVLVNSTVRKELGPKLSGADLATVTTARANPMRGTLLWDEAMYIITGMTVAGGATGGSYTITLQTDAILGYTALPIASATIGPNHKLTGAIVMDNVHQSPGSPLPTHVQITQGSTGLCHFTINAIAKQYRGVLGGNTNKTSERIMVGRLHGDATPATPSSETVDTNYPLGNTNTLGLHKLRLWDKAFFWAIGTSAVTGTWDVDIVSYVHAGLAGSTVTVATTSKTTAGAISALWDKKPLINLFYGSMTPPASVLITEVSAGTNKGLVVVGMAKTGRGTAAKR